MTLEDAANVLIGEEEEGQTKYKSKKTLLKQQSPLWLLIITLIRINKVKTSSEGCSLGIGWNSLAKFFS